MQGLDPEVVELVEAMNALPGIETYCSCCGHGERPFRIWFRVAEGEHRGLFLLTRCSDRRYWRFGDRWQITLSVLDRHDYNASISYVLASSDVGWMAYNQALDLVRSLHEHLEHDAFLEGYGLEELRGLV